MKANQNSDPLVSPQTPEPMPWLNRHQLLTYFILAYAIGWLVLLPRVIASFGPPGATSSAHFNRWDELVFVYAPAFAAVIVTAVNGGSIRHLLGGLVRWRVRLQWYLIAVLLPGFIFLISIPIARLFGSMQLVIPSAGQLIPAFLIGLIIQMVVNMEEVGWRGFALPRMQAGWSALKASLILGVIWSIWHIPLFFLRGNPLQSTPFILFIISTTMLSVLLAWGFNNTDGSLLITQIMHQSFNAWVGPAVLPIAPVLAGGDIRPYLIATILVLGVAILIVVIAGHENLARTPRVKMPLV
jgi:uncharacterized protein